MPIFLANLLNALAAAIIALIAFVGIGGNIFSTSTPSQVEGTENFSAQKEEAKNTVAKTPAVTNTKTTTETKKEEEKNTALSEPQKPSSIPLPKIEPPKIAEVIKITIKQDAEPIPAEPTPTVSEVNDLARNSSVNILCTSTAGSSLHSITGTGVIIDPRGVILTNAHIGQYFLLKDYPSKGGVECVIRVGSPAATRYTAELIFISPLWIQKNSQNLKLTDPTGTGENDFSIIAITGTTNPNSSPPSSFPFVNPDTSELTEAGALSDDYVIAGYPAGFLGGISVLKDLFISSTVLRPKQVFTFNTGTVDLLSFGGNVLAQKGASGSAVVRQKDKKLVGLIVTTTEESSTDARELHAITLSHINRSLLVSAGLSLSQVLTGDINSRILDFNSVLFEPLKKILIQDLN